MLIQQRSCARTALRDARGLDLERFDDKAKSAKNKDNLAGNAWRCVCLAKAGSRVPAARTELAVTT